MLSLNIKLVRSDLKIIRRDPMFILCTIAPILILLVALLLLPIISRLTTQWLNFPLTDYFPIICLFLFPLTPMMFGMIYGFILLDERDGGIINYLSITPIGKKGYLFIRMTVPVLLSFLMSTVFLFATGFTKFLNGFEIVLLSVITSFEAPLMLLFLGAFADNKVEGMAITKGFGIIMLPMVIDYFLKGSWRWAMGISPLWWIERAVFCDSSFRWIYLSGAVFVHVIFIYLLYKKFEKKFG